jgi:hypothetical protein
MGDANAIAKRYMGDANAIAKRYMGDAKRYMGDRLVDLCVLLYIARDGVRNVLP